jgi:hypothetical protein
VSGSYATSTGLSTDQQSKFHSESSSSNLIVSGGSPGSFGPSRSVSEQPDWGSWASTVDLHPVPISYRLDDISNLINPNWVNFQNENVSQGWQNAVAQYPLTVRQQALQQQLNSINQLLIFIMVVGSGPDLSFMLPLRYLLCGSVCQATPTPFL